MKKKKSTNQKQSTNLTFSEFVARWKKGIEQVTPKQKLKSQLLGTKIMMIGLMGGIIISFFDIESFWWLLLILIGGLINTLVQYLGQKQQVIFLDNIEEQMKK